MLAPSAGPPRSNKQKTLILAFEANCIVQKLQFCRVLAHGELLHSYMIHNHLQVLVLTVLFQTNEIENVCTMVFFNNLIFVGL